MNTCATPGCDRAPLRPHDVCGLCLRARRDGLAVVQSGQVYRRESDAERAEGARKLGELQVVEAGAATARAEAARLEAARRVLGGEAADGSYYRLAQSGSRVR